MRKFGFGLALVATAQITLLSSPALADDANASVESAPPPKANQSKATVGWVVLGAGGAVAVGGIVVDAIAAGKNKVSGPGGTGDDGTTQGAKTNLLFAGTTMVLAGVLTAIYGGSLVASSHRTDVGAQTASPPVNGSSDPVTKAAQASLAGAPAFVLPVVGARF
jgi:hypothetical protein